MSAFEVRMKKGSKKILEALLEVGAVEHETEQLRTSEPSSFSLDQGIETMYATDTFNLWQPSSGSGQDDGFSSPLSLSPRQPSDAEKGTDEEDFDKENCPPFCKEQQNSSTSR